MKTHYSDSPLPYKSPGMNSKSGWRSLPAHQRLSSMDRSKTPGKTPVSSAAGVAAPSGGSGGAGAVMNLNLNFEDAADDNDPKSLFFKKFIHAAGSVPGSVDDLISKHTAPYGETRKTSEEIGNLVESLLEDLKKKDIVAIFSLEDSYFANRAVPYNDEETIECYKENDLAESLCTLNEYKNNASEGSRLVELQTGMFNAAGEDLKQLKETVYGMISEWLHTFITPLYKDLEMQSKAYEAKATFFLSKRNYLENAIEERHKVSRFLEYAGVLAGNDGTKANILEAMEVWVGICCAADVLGLPVSTLQKKFNLLFVLGLPQSNYIVRDFGFKMAKLTINCRGEEKIRFALFTGLPLHQVVSAFGYAPTKRVWTDTSHKDFPLPPLEDEGERELRCALECIECIFGGAVSRLDEEDIKLIKKAVDKKMGGEAKFEWATNEFWSSVTEKDD